MKFPEFKFPGTDEDLGLGIADIYMAMLGLRKAGEPGLSEALDIAKNDEEQRKRGLGRYSPTRDYEQVLPGSIPIAPKVPQGQVLGEELTPQYQPPTDLAPEVPQNWFETYQIPQIEGRQPVEEVLVDEDTVKRFVTNARKWAGTGTTNPEQSNLTYRYKVSPEVLKENADFVGKYVEAVMRLAPYFDLPPKTIASTIMHESGWGGQRFDGNLGGYGFPGEGDVDQGYRFKADTIEEMAAKYLEQLAKYRYAGVRSPQDLAARGYNTHAEYPGKVMDVYRMLDAPL